ncbi:YdeI/OmpD-associated family protein [Flavobacterium sp. NG2]|uniref:YdeI/OmpD-associated family protein n=1 Tax=Flavobacterium sp. NG2 TaxID=3097547 RepID=UPI002A82F0B1|nr:YdeI/OmpD-associated family protein [Flavobacterium sp. NG2]WPR70541.1 YdeI/OmpD-associated family protein [Flavobacterium sp. NG2]
MNSKLVDRFLARAKKWNEEMSLLRKICLDCGLTETYKWMHPCYTFQEKNVVLIHNFKEYCALLFHKGVLLKDTNDILVQQTENVQAARQIRFTNSQQIIDLESVIKTYIYQAIEIEKAGLEVKLKPTSAFEMPDEFKKALETNSDLKKAFESLTPGRQRGYLLFFSQAKQSKTRESRIEKCIPTILNGKGLKD